MNRTLVFLCTLPILIVAAQVASGQQFPNKPIRIVTSEVGGGTDFTARLVAQGLSAVIGQQVIVDNRASAFIPGDIVSKALPDGYTLLIAASTFSIAPLLQKAPYDPVQDFAALSMVTREPGILVIHPAVAANTVAELIAVAKARPGQLNYVSTGTGSSNHLAGELFASLAGVKLVHVPYKGTGAALNDLIAGEVHMRFGSTSAVAPHVKTGKLKALAVTSLEPAALFPALPTVAATLPGYESVGMVGAFAPAKTPAAIINRLNQEIVRVLNQADVKAKFLNVGSEAVSSTPEALMDKMKAEIARMGKLIRDANIHAQ